MNGFEFICSSNVKVIICIKGPPLDLLISQIFMEKEYSRICYIETKLFCRYYFFTCYIKLQIRSNILKHF